MLTILVETRVKRVIFEKGRAVGIEYTADGVGGPVITARAKKLVVLSAGAFGSPSILERSGIGSSSILKKHGVPVIVDLPGVGENYQDHVSSILVCYAPDGSNTMDDVWMDPEATKMYVDEWEDTGKGKIATNGIEAFVKLRPTKAELNVLGPGFKSRWESFYENYPDKPIGMIASVAGYVFVSRAELFLLLILHQFAEVWRQVSLEIHHYGLQHSVPRVHWESPHQSWPGCECAVGL
jgi:alcohol oxidase